MTWPRSLVLQHASTGNQTQMRSYAMHLFARKLSPSSRDGTIADTAVTSSATLTHTGAFPWIRTPTIILVARMCDLACTVSNNTANGRKLGSQNRAVSMSSMLRRRTHRSKGHQIKALIRRLWLPVCRVIGTGVPSESKTGTIAFIARNPSLQKPSLDRAQEKLSVNGHPLSNRIMGFTLSRHTRFGIPCK